MTTFIGSDLEGIDGYKLLTGLVVPRPIGWIGTRSADGADNLAPFSFFGAVSGDPPTVVFAPGATGQKDSRDFAIETGVFTVNVVTADVVEAMNATAATLPTGESEFIHAGLTPIEGEVVNAPRVAECAATMECRVTQHLHVGREGGGNSVIFGEVVAIHVDDQLVDGTRVDQAALGAIGRHVGNWYSTTENLFAIERPR